MPWNFIGEKFRESNTHWKTKTIFASFGVWRNLVKNMWKWCTIFPNFAWWVIANFGVLSTRPYDEFIQICRACHSVGCRSLSLVQSLAEYQSRWHFYTSQALEIRVNLRLINSTLSGKGDKRLFYIIMETRYVLWISVFLTAAVLDLSKVRIQISLTLFVNLICSNSKHFVIMNGLNWHNCGRSIRWKKTWSSSPKLFWLSKKKKKKKNQSVHQFNF